MHYEDLVYGLSQAPFFLKEFTACQNWSARPFGMLIECNVLKDLKWHNLKENRTILKQFNGLAYDQSFKMVHSVCD